MTTGPKPRDAKERFWAKVDKTGDCWLWTAFRNAQGYGAFGLCAGVTVTAHKFAYETVIGPVPRSKVIRHVCHDDDTSCPGGIKCTHRRCVNPDHLEAVDQQRYGPRLGTTVACVQCGKEFYRKKSSPSRKLCSRACQTAWLRDHQTMGFIGSADNSGEKSGSYKDGKSVGRINKLTLRRAVIARDSNWCLVCGKGPPGLHLHRVRYGSEGGVYEFGNCVQLCGSHHDLMHSDKRRFKPLLLAYLAGELSADAYRSAVMSHA